MASLLERMNIDAPSSVGPVRNKGNRGGASPYSRSPRLPKGDVNGDWKHDMFEQHNSLSSRLGNTQAVPKVNTLAAHRALQEAHGERGFSIKGASSGKGNVVEVSGLADGTTPEDVEAIFKRCGIIIERKLSKSKPVTVRITFKNEKDAQSAVTKFNGQPADGRTLSVKVIGEETATLAGRLSVAVDDSVDVLMGNSGPSGGSKLRSDEILATDSRASVLVAPPGADPRDYTQRPNRGRGRGRGRSRGGRRGGAARMDVDS